MEEKVGGFMFRILKKGIFLLILVLVGVGLWTVFDGRSDPDGVTIVIDPGHGGSDPGAVWDGAEEKSINLAVALKVRDLLEQEMDLRVLMTREEDRAVDLYDRAGFANEEKATLFVSIHSNALENDHDYEGILTFYHKRDRSGMHLAEEVQAAVAAETGGIDRGVRAEDYVVLRETDAPACLLEMGFMTTPAELERLLDPDYQDCIAAGVVEGILTYLKS